MANGAKQGVLAMLALEKISKDIQGLMSSIEEGLEAEVQDIAVIQEKLNNIAEKNKKQRSEE